MKLIVITLPEFFPQEAYLIDLLFDNGLETLHLRKPESNETEFENLLESINPKNWNKIVTHDHFSLAAKYNLKGIHLNKRNDVIPENFNGTISKSMHSAEELVTEKQKYNYVSLSPIYNSVSKKGYNSKFTEKELLELKYKGLIDEKVYALGGITAQNIGLLKNFGFGGAMILGSIWQNIENPEQFEKNFKILQTSYELPESKYLQ